MDEPDYTPYIYLGYWKLFSLNQWLVALVLAAPCQVQNTPLFLIIYTVLTDLWWWIIHSSFGTWPSHLEQTFFFHKYLTPFRLLYPTHKRSLLYTAQVAGYKWCTTSSHKETTRYLYTRALFSKRPTSNMVVPLRSSWSSITGLGLICHFPKVSLTIKNYGTVINNSTPRHTFFNTHATLGCQGFRNFVEQSHVKKNMFNWNVFFPWRLSKVIFVPRQRWVWVVSWWLIVTLSGKDLTPVGQRRPITRYLRKTFSSSPLFRHRFLFSSNMTIINRRDRQERLSSFLGNGRLNSSLKSRFEYISSSKPMSHYMLYASLHVCRFLKPHACSFPTLKMLYHILRRPENIACMLELHASSRALMESLASRRTAYPCLRRNAFETG